jgi:signal transduction histidine kinase
VARTASLQLLFAIDRIKAKLCAAGQLPNKDHCWYIRGDRSAFTCVSALSVLRESQDHPSFLLATLPPSSRQVRLAWAVIGALLFAFVAAAPLKDVQLARADAFVPIVQTAIIVNDLITASLLFSQFLIVRQRALLVLASGYLFSALVAVPYTLAFPGVFAPAGLLGAGLQSTPWLYFFGHGGLALAVVAYALLKDADDSIGESRSPPAIAIGLSIAVVFAIVAGLTALSTRWDSLLPKIMLDSVRVNLEVRPWYGGVMLAMAVTAFVVILFRRRSVLDLWLTVMCSAWVLELLLGTTFVTARFSVGWYASRVFSLAAAITVLIVLLSETTTLYAHLARSEARRRQAREMRQVAMDVMAASIAHEISQPLTALVANARAATKLLSMTNPDIEEISSALDDIAKDGNRASEVISGIRSMFNKELHGRVLLDANEVVWEAFALIGVDLRMQQISSSMDLHPELPQVLADRGQLQQVMLNLIANAVDAMRGVSGRPRLLRVGSYVTADNSKVEITVEDSGMGVSENHLSRIFEPFFTTKSAGTGIGLAICRSIIEAHGGELLASANDPYGMVFRINLPVHAL